jgi:hypothetical protein
MLESFKFWKHEEPGQMEPGSLEPIPGVDTSGLVAPAENPFQQMSQLTKTSDKDLELISAKLDVLKAQLDNIIQRLDRLEQKEQQNKVERVKW